ncbi:hypothetical protein BDV11DRAFT_134312 [Aspergillus similis]
MRCCCLGGDDYMIGYPFFSPEMKRLFAPNSSIVHKIISSARIFDLHLALGRSRAMWCNKLFIAYTVIIKISPSPRYHTAVDPFGDVGKSRRSHNLRAVLRGRVFYKRALVNSAWGILYMIGLQTTSRVSCYLVVGSGMTRSRWERRIMT